MQPKSSSDVTQAAAAAAVGGSMGVQFKSTKSKNKKTAHRSPLAAECRGSAMAAKASAPLVVWFVCSWICALCEGKCVCVSSQSFLFIHHGESYSLG